MSTVDLEKYSFQYCQKIVIFSKDLSKVLLCKRHGEADYDGVYSFIGGKMERSDESILSGIRREKNEEVGEQFVIEVFPTFVIPVYFQKKDGHHMLLPHYFARHKKGDVRLSKEYSEFLWVEKAKLPEFEPKIKNIPEIVDSLLNLSSLMKKKDFVIM